MACVVPWLWAFTLGCVAAGTLLNESFNPTILNRYSPAWSAVILASLVSVAVATTVAVRRSVRASKASEVSDGGGHHLLVGAGAASWGASLVTQYVVDPFHIRRLFVGEFFGATQTAGVLLEYLAQVFFGLALLLWLTTQALRARRRGASGVAGVLIILASVPAAYLIGEGGTRIANIVWLQPQGEPTKATRMWRVRHSAEENSLGFRDREFERPTGRNEFRVLALGDSITYGIGVADRKDLFISIVAERLKVSRRFQSVKVFNAGIPGSHSVDHLGVLEQLRWLESDLVILVYYFNDIEHLSPLPLGETPFGAPSFWSRIRPHRLLMLNSHLFDQLLLRYRRANRMNPEAARPDHFFDAYANSDLLRPHLDVLTQIAAKAQSAGAAFRLVPFDIGVRLDERYEARYRRFVEMCVRRGIQVWSLAHVFDGSSYWDLRVNRWDGHPNERAHRVVADFLVERILTEGEALARHPEYRGMRADAFGVRSGRVQGEE